VGLSVFSDSYEYYSPEKGSDRHHRMILNDLENLTTFKPQTIVLNGQLNIRESSVLEQK